MRSAMGFWRAGFRAPPSTAWRSPSPSGGKASPSPSSRPCWTRSICAPASSWQSSSKSNGRGFKSLIRNTFFLFAREPGRRYNRAAYGARALQGVCMATDLPHGYRPLDEEPFMNERQREYFRRKLVAWKEDILRESRETIQNLQSEPTPNADLADRATTEAERQLELRTRDRQRKLISKIDSALRRLEDGSYGFCEETGEPISLKRLDARPIATLSVEAQERHERRERVYRDD